MNFECREKCGECCYLVPFDEGVFVGVKDKANRKIIKEIKIMSGLILPVTSDLKCCFLKDDLSCAIYKDRPDVCKNFGKKSNPCPYIKPNGEERTHRGVAIMKNHTGLPDESNVNMAFTVNSDRGIPIDPDKNMKINIDI